MNIVQVCKRIKEDESFRRKKWSKKKICFGRASLASEYQPGIWSNSLRLHRKDLIADDWEIVKDEKICEETF